MDIVLSDTRLQAILFNIFGGLTRCDEVAMAIRNYLKEHEVNIPMVVRLSGTRSESVQEILKDVNVTLVDNINSAVSEALRLGEQNKNRRDT